jgi:hypothetical protein
MEEQLDIFDFPTFRFWAYLMKVIPETCQLCALNLISTFCKIIFPLCSQSELLVSDGTFLIEIDVFYLKFAYVLHILTFNFVYLSIYDYQKQPLLPFWYLSPL